MLRGEETSSNNTDLESGLSSVSHSVAIPPDTTPGSSCLFYPPAGHEVGRPKSLPNLSIPSLSKLPLSSLSIKIHRTATDRPRSPLGSSPSPTLNAWSRSPTLVLPMPLLSPDDHEFPRGQSMLQRLFDRSWVQPAIGLTTLLITLIALFVYSHRSFVMAKWTEKNDILQACAQLIQCQAMLSAGPTPPPYIKDSMFQFDSQARRLLSRALDSQNVTKKMLKFDGEFGPTAAAAAAAVQIPDPSTSMK
ncbi:MAG: hypothetical protein Q9194_004936 [Teloschistes cf. exilis]